MKRRPFPLSLCLGLLLGLCPALAQDSSDSSSSPPPKLKPFLLGGIQTHELDHQRWMAALHQAGMNAVQVTAYAYQGPWNTSKLWYNEQEPAVLNEIRTARQNGLQVVLVLRVALDHNEPANRFLWHGLTYPESREATREWFRTYTDFVLKWGRIAEREGVEVLGIASEMNSLAATLPVDEIPPLAQYYLDDGAQQRLRDLVARSEHQFTDEARLGMGAGDFKVLDDFLVERNRAERLWARAYTFDGAEDRPAAINRRRELLEALWRGLVKEVRKIYSGRLTLAANFDNYHEVAFWDALDFIGINAYFPLRATLETPLSKEGLVSSWRDIFRDIDAFRETHQLSRPVIFTELGYTRYQGVTIAPWSSQGFIPLWDPAGETENDRAFFWASQPIEPEERALAVEALHEVWLDGAGSLAGVLYWKLSSRLDLQRYEPFMLYLGQDAEDPLYGAFTRFAQGDIRPLSPLLRTSSSEIDPYLRAADAVIRDDLGALKILGQEALATPPQGRPPLLHLAARLGRSSAVRQLLAIGSRLDLADAAGFLPIHWSCYAPDPEGVSSLVPSGEGPWLDERGETPLMKCARLDNHAVARRLIELGDAVRARNLEGRSALHLAVDQATKTTVDLLLGHGSDVDARDERGNTPLHVAARRGDAEIVRVLAERSKRLANQEGIRPVHEAAFHGKADVFQLLFEPSKATDLNAEQQSLLHFAAFGGDLDILRTLLPFFSSVDLPDENGWTPLFYAVQDGQVEAVGLLLEHGASSRYRADDRSTPLHHAGSSGVSGVLREMLEQEVDVDLVDGDGNTALHHAAGWGRLDNIRMLLAAGAATNLRNRKGETPLEVAVAAGRHRAAELLSAPG